MARTPTGNAREGSVVESEPQNECLSRQPSLVINIVGPTTLTDCRVMLKGWWRLVMSNQRFFKIVCFRFPTNVPKKSNIFVFSTKFIVEPKRSLSDLKIFCPKAIDFSSFQIFLRLQKVLFWF
jgi:hypothetical protein